MTTPGGDAPYVAFYRACEARSMLGFRLLAPRIWAEDLHVDHPDGKLFHHEWRISIDDTPIGNVAGDEFDFAIAP
jgi:hypothetical protein